MKTKTSYLIINIMVTIVIVGVMIDFAVMKIEDKLTQLDNKICLIITKYEKNYCDTIHYEIKSLKKEIGIK